MEGQQHQLLEVRLRTCDANSSDCTTNLTLAERCDSNTGSLSTHIGFKMLPSKVCMLGLSRTAGTLPVVFALYSERQVHGG